MKQILLAAAAACAFGASAGGFLSKATPESQGVDSAAILKWIDANEKTFDGGPMGRLHGFVLLRHGRVIAEGSWKPFDTLNETHMLYSHSKSFTASAIGLLVDAGKLDLDERVLEIFPEFDTPALPVNAQRLRVRDLLTMNVGAKRHHILGENGDWVANFFSKDFSCEPGRRFQYDSDATYLLMAIVERRSGMKAMDFLRTRLLEPIGITKAWTTTSPQGIPCGGWGLNTTTRDLAHFGQLYLDRGLWNGTRILSSDWVDLATARQTWSDRIKIGVQSIGEGSDWSQGYGFQFWRCRHGCYRADGAGGQFTIVMPGRDAVLSVHAGLADFQKVLNLVWENILPGIKDGPLPENRAASAALEKRCAALALPPVAGAAKGEDAFVGRDFVFKPNARGFHGVRLDRDAKGGWTVKLYARAWPTAYAVGFGEWKKGAVWIDREYWEGMSTIIGNQTTFASGAVRADGSFFTRAYLTGTTAYIDLVFSMKDGKPVVAVDFFGMNGAAVEGYPAPEKVVARDVPALLNGRPWEERRAEIVRTFAENEFGVRPVERPADLAFNQVAENPILGGKGRHRAIRASATGPLAPFAFTLHVYEPAGAEKVPSFVAINLGQRLRNEGFDPNRADPSIASMPVKDILARGFAVVSFENNEVAVDDALACFTSGVFRAWGPARRDGRAWGALSAWAWGASRAMDWIETQPQYDAKRVAVIGHSRGGKTALWAGATDERFALACVNDSGAAGARLNRTEMPWAESISGIVGCFPHWFCQNYRAWGRTDAPRDFDQHHLLAALAPRMLAVGSATDDWWAGPAAERLAAELAAPAWEALGKRGFGVNVRYHLRKGGHNLVLEDWTAYMDQLGR